MEGLGYVMIWIVLLLILLAAGWRRKWSPFAIYATGCLVLLLEELRNHGGWDDLAAFATLIVIVVPIYVVGTIVWLVGWVLSRRRRR
ncbi:hypothetical protein [Paenibacillus sp. R14(2021)]|uniref:hypothetical protein n=1 Tax=Paenibacillus sp. R14(2021) TaxID=2859228 RepID=UPI001C614072|nr:hypothetical protein [Paenibacillus sp. R14(2021)]